jgi:DNA-binding LacI/PurR family transcriptional regulator
VHAIVKTGVVRGRQRYFCKQCNYYFTLPENKEPASITPPPRQQRQVTILDIATQLKISKSTVSRALNGHTDINPVTREAVLEAARRLNYSPNQLAYNLVKRKSYTIGIIVPEFINSFFPNFIIACQEAALAAGYQVIICHSNESFKNEVDNARMLYAHRVDGLLISITRQTQDLSHLHMFASNNIPVVMFNRVDFQSKFSKVVVDDYASAFNAVKHLIANGYKKIGHIAGPENLSIATNRLEGYKAALKANGLPLCKKHIVRHNLTAVDARNAANKLLSLKDRPDAIFAINDPAAIQAMLLAKEKGIAIPEQLGIVGFSNDIRSEVIAPGLTTFEQPIEEMGKKSFALLQMQMVGIEQPQPELITLQAELIIRGSSVRK